MRYLSIDLEATGLAENDYIIEFAAVPFCTDSRDIKEDLSYHNFIKCPSYESLEERLSDWVKENNKQLIEKASVEGLSKMEFQDSLSKYLRSKDIQNFFKDGSIILFGKSMNAIDLPFMNRDLGWDFMRSHFNHRTHDLSSIVYEQIDRDALPREAESGSFLMNHLGFGEVAHTALEDAVNTVKMYFKILDLDSN